MNLTTGVKMPTEIKEILEKIDNVYPMYIYDVEPIFRDLKLISVEQKIYSSYSNYFYETKIYKIDNKFYKFTFLLESKDSVLCLLISFKGEVDAKIFN